MILGGDRMTNARWRSTFPITSSSWEVVPRGRLVRWTNVRPLFIATFEISWPP